MSFKNNLSILIDLPVCGVLILAYFAFRIRDVFIRKEQKYIRLLIILSIAAILGDALYSFVELYLVPQGRQYLRFMYGASIIYYIIMTLHTDSWWLYTLHLLGNPKKITVVAGKILIIAQMASIIIAIALRGTPYLVTSDAAGNLQYGILDSIIAVFLLALIALSLVAGIANWFDKKKYADREKTAIIIVYALLLLVSSVLQYELDRSLLCEMGIILGGVYLFFVSCNSMMYTDELTTLNNKRRLHQVMSEKMDAKDKFYFVMIDVDNFKSINDSFGHNEGDNALCIIADTLRQVAGKGEVSAYRYGGDEFAMIIASDSEDRVADTCRHINDILSKNPEYANLPYKLSVSYGYCEYIPEEGKYIPQIIQTADENMYSMKQQKKLQA